MMQLETLTASRGGRAKEAALPPAVCRDIHLLAQKVAMSCDASDEERQVVVLVRQRPIDRLGRAGCHVEILANGRMPCGGLEAVRSAGGTDVWCEKAVGGTNRSTVRCTPISRTVGLEESLLGGWKLTYDVRWMP